MTTRLMQTLDFTEEDLTYNCKGMLSPRQTARVTQKRRLFKLALLLLGILLGGGGGGILASEGFSALTKDASAALGTLVGAGVLALIGAPLIYLGIRPMRPVSVAGAKGKARLACVQRTSRSRSGTSTFIATELHLVGKIFSIPDKVFPELEDGAVYAVYYWDGLDVIFSLERL